MEWRSALYGIEGEESNIYIDVASIEIWFESNYFLVNVKLAA
jgi:hypothetical protein